MPPRSEPASSAPSFASGAVREAPHAAQFRGFRRARRGLCAVMLGLVALGARLHAAIAGSPGAKLAWMLGCAAVIAYPMGRLLQFRCPRCGHSFLATGSIADFVRVGRVLWGERCGTCGLCARDSGR